VIFKSRTNGYISFVFNSKTPVSPGVSLGGGPYVTLSIDEQQSWNYGDDGEFSKRISLTGSLDGPNIYSFISVYSPTPSDWVVGQLYSGHMQARGPNNDYRDIYSSLILTDISPFEAVPEPSSFILFGVAVIVMMGAKRNWKKVS
jgi:ubiquitin C-terminal hydrolase